MKMLSNPVGWFLAGLVCAAACAGALWALVMTHTAPPLWLVVCLVALALVAVFCFGAAEDLIWAQREGRRDPPEFGPARYTGPERRRGGRAQRPRPMLVVTELPKSPQPTVDEWA